MDPLPLALSLMEIDSTSGREADVIAFAEEMLTSRGWEVSRIPVSPGRDDLWARSVAVPLLTFSTHLDTVPPYLPPSIEDGRLCGRGACDAKGIAAAMIVAAERLRSEGIPVGLLFVVGEETIHDGAIAANRVQPGSRILINGEPTESTLSLGTKGALRLIVRTTGEAAHSAYPHLGRSAVDGLVRLLGELREIQWPSDPLLGETTVNVGMISGGVADNVMAPAAEARLMVRLVGDPEPVLTRLTEWAAGRATIEVGAIVPPVRLEVVPGFPTSVAAYATDIPKLDRWGTPYLFGPGSIHVAHRDDEHIEIAELRAAVDAYVRLAAVALKPHRT